MKAGSASSTAKLIAAATVLLAADSRTRNLVAPGAAELCRRCLSFTPADRWLAASASNRFTRGVWRTIERFTQPGIVEHYWRRKRWIEARCRAAIGAGYERLIIVGAGFDTLGCRLSSELPGLEAIEVDHPSTQAVKRRALEGAAVRFVAVDLSSEALPAPLLEDAKPTLIVLEGVLMYLEPHAIDRLFASFAAMSAKRLCVIFTFMTRWPDGTSGFRPRSWLAERWLALRGEPFAWAIEPDALTAFLAARGLTLEELALTRDLGTDATAIDGENLALCVRNRSSDAAAVPVAQSAR